MTADMMQDWCRIGAGVSGREWSWRGGGAVRTGGHVPWGAKMEHAFAQATTGRGLRPQHTGEIVTMTGMATPCVSTCVALLALLGAWTPCGASQSRFKISHQGVDFLY